MIKKLLCLSFCLMMGVAQAKTPPGFLWYNLPKIPAKQKPALRPGSVPFSQLSYTDKDAVLNFYTMEALHKVRHTHSIEDEKVFLAMQDYWLKEASLHGRINQLALLKYPEYDFAVNHPTSDIGLKLRDSLENQKVELRLKTLATTHGVLFFYRANNVFDRKQIPIAKDFCEQFHFELIPIAVDGVISPELPNSKIDAGYADALKVHFFPAMLLVNPKAKTTSPVAFGVTTQDELIRNMIAVTSPMNTVAS